MIYYRPLMKSRVLSLISALILLVSVSAMQAYAQTAYAVSGNVKYKVNSTFKTAKSVKITATNTVSGAQLTTLTNAKGDYSLSVSSATYTIKASDAKNTPFLPAEYTISVTGNVIGVNFVGNLK